MWAIVFVFLLILMGIYTGLFTPTEAGAFGAVVVLILGLVRRKLSWRGIKLSIQQSGVTLGMVGLLLVGSLVLNLFIVRTGIPQVLAEFVKEVAHSPFVFLWMVLAIYFILGCFFDGIAIMLLTLPIFFPISSALGVDPIHFGVVVSVVILIGCISPPFGIISYSVGTAAKDVPLIVIFRGSIPFVLSMIIGSAIVIHFPQVSLFLVGKMFN